MSKKYYLLSFEAKNYHNLMWGTKEIAEENVTVEYKIAAISEHIEDIINHLTPNNNYRHTRIIDLAGISFKDKIDACFFKDVLIPLEMLHEAKIRKNRRLNA